MAIESILDISIKLLKYLIKSYKISLVHLNIHFFNNISSLQ